MSGTLLHICCAPCSVACVKLLREEGVEPVGFWYNPNIHPFQEYKARRDTLRQYAKDIGLALEEEDFYGLRQFTAAVAADSDRLLLRLPHGAHRPVRRRARL